MKIFKVKCNSKDFQTVFLTEPDAYTLQDMTFDCRPRSASWAAPEVFVLHPKLKRGNFFGFGDSAGTFSADARAADELADLFEMAGEVLPLSFAGEGLSLVNVTECTNILDHEHTQWIYGESHGEKIRIERYAFYAERLTEAPLFKIPEMNSVGIFTVEGMKDPDDEFKGRVERLGLTGLIFDELWSD